MVNITYISDLHIEFHKGNWDIKKKYPFERGDILCLAGDIGYPQHVNYNLFLGHCSERFKYVVFIAGNHEYYMKESIEETNRLICRIASAYPNVVFLDNATHYVEEYDLYVVGTTLWTHTRQLTEEDVVGYNDFHRIQNMHLRYMNQLHEQSCEFLTRELDKLKGSSSKVVVMTHHLPSERMIHNKYKGHPLTPLFANQMDDLFDRYKMDVWICGHSHSDMQTTIGHTRVVLHPVGYPGENHNIDVNVHIVIP